MPFQNISARPRYIARDPQSRRRSTIIFSRWRHHAEKLTDLDIKHHPNIPRLGLTQQIQKLRKPTKRLLRLLNCAKMPKLIPITILDVPIDTKAAFQISILEGISDLPIKRVKRQDTPSILRETGPRPYPESGASPSLQREHRLRSRLQRPQDCSRGTLRGSHGARWLAACVCQTHPCART